MSFFGRLFARRLSALPGEGSIEVLQKVVRAQTKQGMLLEEIEGKVEAGFADLHTRLDDLPSRGAGVQDIEWGPLLDAMDALDEAARQATPEVAVGLKGVLARLERFVADVGLDRRSAAGGPPDGALFRVVGSEPADAQASVDGVVARVVRAAVLRGDEVVREGEVTVWRRSQ